MNTAPEFAAGLERVLPRLGSILPGLEVGPTVTVLGPVRFAGCNRPLPSSAARLRVASDTVWMPAPIAPDDKAAGPAPFYLYAGRVHVLPVIRLFEADSTVPRYLTLADWLAAAIAEWRFPTASLAEPATFLEWAEARSGTRDGPTTGERLRDLALLVRYALFGADRETPLTGLRLPPRPGWLRPVGATAVARAAARSLVATARSVGPGVVPRIEVRGTRSRVQPRQEADRGIDPVHTPEGDDIRLTGRLGAGVRVVDGKLQTATDAVPLGPSTGRVPYAGYDDPRRLLMAANMQAQAIPVAGNEPPLVRAAGDGPDPPGVNLRVAYLAWRGLNHEDAWVLSESAARKLGHTAEWDQWIGFRTVEAVHPESGSRVLVRPGDQVRRGQRLVERRLAPALLDAPLAAILALPDPAADTVTLRPEFGDRAARDGEVVAVETFDLPGRVPDGAVIGDLAGLYRTLVRVRLRRALPLGVGDKLANRHGHKGIVGAILPDADMPRWDGQPVDALIDPISVLNRSNWGQVYESLAGFLAVRTGTPARSDLDRAALLAQVRSHGTDELGRSAIEPPSASPGPDWPMDMVRAVAGVQFVLRLPQHAADKLSVAGDNHVPESRGRPQRFGEMESWAAWAHGFGRPTGGVRLSAPAARLGRLLEAAGYQLIVEPGRLRVQRLDPTRPPGPDDEVFPLDEPFLATAYDRLEEISGRCVLVFDPPLPPRHTRALRVLPAADRPDALAADGSLTAHPLTQALRRIVRLARPQARWAARARNALADLREGDHLGSGDPPPAVEHLDWTAGDPATVLESVAALRSPAGDGPPTILRWEPDLLPPLPGSAEACWVWVHKADGENAGPGATAITAAVQELVRVLRELSGPEQAERTRRLARAVAGYRATARSAAIGASGRGEGNSKFSFLRRAVLGRRVRPSARAVIAPGGPLHLALDEIAVPPAVATGLFGPAGPGPDARVWVKRDPVLHRWGLVSVRVRVVEGATVRLPAALLGPMQADFDGDTVALFRDIPGGANGSPDAADPRRLIGHPLLGQAMYLPGKQFLYGLHLLQSDPAALRDWQAHLGRMQAPPWPEGRSVKDALTVWAGQAAGGPPPGLWWADLERFAVRALAVDPGMGLGLFATVEEVLALPVVRCGAAKKLVENEPSRLALQLLLDGRSLDVYRPGNDAADPIREVMVAARLSVGRFGGVLRRLLHGTGAIDAEYVRAAQCLTEAATQRALSVKAGQAPLAAGPFDAQIRRLLHGEDPPTDRLLRPELTRLTTLLERFGSSLDAAARQEMRTFVGQFIDHPDAAGLTTLLRLLDRTIEASAGARPGVRKRLRRLRAVLGRYQPLIDFFATPAMLAAWQAIRKAAEAPVSPGILWLREPHRLDRLLSQHERLELPIDDLRVGPWLAAGEG